MKTPFLNPKLEGMRFEEHSVPLDVLKDLAAFEDLIVRVARSIYLSENPNRKRVPDGFYEGFSLHISGIENGSAVPVIEQVQPDRLDASKFGPFFERSRDLVLKTIMAAAIGGAIPTQFPRQYLGYFDQFGKSLRPDERVQLSVPGRNEPGAVYNAATRKKLVLMGGAAEYTQTGVLRGHITAHDIVKHTFILDTVTGERVPVEYTADYADIVRESFDQKRAKKVIVGGLIAYDPNDHPKRIELISHMDQLELNDVPARIEEFLLLKDGWLDGDGRAPDPVGIRWLADVWDSLYPESLPKPYAYPTPDGGIQLEWTKDQWELSAKIDLEKQAAELFAVKVGTDEDSDLIVDLSSPGSWTLLVDFVRSRVS